MAVILELGLDSHFGSLELCSIGSCSEDRFSFEDGLELHSVGAGPRQWGTMDAEDTFAMAAVVGQSVAVSSELAFIAYTVAIDSSILIPRRSLIFSLDRHDY